MSETNPLGLNIENAQDYHNQYNETVYWTDPRLAKITRIRLLSDPGHPVWDVSYVHGELKDGTYVRVSVGFDRLPKRNIASIILAAAKADKIYAKGLGIFLPGVISTFQ